MFDSHILSSATSTMLRKTPLETIDRALSYFWGSGLPEMNWVAYSISSPAETRDRALSYFWGSGLPEMNWVAYSISSSAETRDRALSYFWEMDFLKWTGLRTRFRAQQKPETGLSAISGKWIS